MAGRDFLAEFKALKAEKEKAAEAERLEAEAATLEAAFLAVEAEEAAKALEEAAAAEEAANAPSTPAEVLAGAPSTPEYPPPSTLTKAVVWLNKQFRLLLLRSRARKSRHAAKTQMSRSLGLCEKGWMSRASIESWTQCSMCWW